MFAVAVSDLQVLLVIWTINQHETSSDFPFQPVFLLNCAAIGETPGGFWYDNFIHVSC